MIRHIVWIKNGNESSHIAQRVENIGSDAGGSVPVVLALWFCANQRAKAETSDRLHAFSQLARCRKRKWLFMKPIARVKKPCSLKGTICSFAHQQYMLSVVRSLLYVDDLIYADGTRLFFARLLSAPIPHGVFRRRIIQKKAGYRYLLLSRYAFLSPVLR